MLLLFAALFGVLFASTCMNETQLSQDTDWFQANPSSFYKDICNAYVCPIFFMLTNGFNETPVFFRFAYQAEQPKPAKLVCYLDKPGPFEYPWVTLRYESAFIEAPEYQVAGECGNHTLEFSFTLWENNPKFSLRTRPGEAALFYNERGRFTEYTCNESHGVACELFVSEPCETTQEVTTVLSTTEEVTTTEQTTLEVTTLEETTQEVETFTTSTSFENDAWIIVGLVVAWLAFIVISASIVILLGIGCILFYQEHIRLKKKALLRTDETYVVTPSIYGVTKETQDLIEQIPCEPSQTLSTSRVKKSKWILEYTDIDLQGKLGSGAFGVVYKGQWRGSMVAVKQLVALESKKDFETFEAEFQIMKRLKNHPNIVPVIGMTTYPLTIVTMYMPGGTLLALLQSDEVLNNDLLMQMVSGITAGMVHLEAEGIVHRDLAARNVLLTEKRQAVITDFGMSRNITGSAAGKTVSNVGPLKWMAPECLSSQLYSHKSDVWAWGVTVWECFTRQEPYPDLDSIQAVLAVQSGRRLPIPIGSPATIQKLLLRSFQSNPEERPDFKEILSILQQ